ncbi:MAG: hypothetical protein AAFR84_00240 [Pseudomonadota bacterium]
MQPAYERTRRARSPLNVIVLLFILAFAATAAALGAEWWFFIPLILAFLPIAVTLIHGKDARFTVDDSAVSWDDGWRGAQIALAEIDHLRIEDWSDSTDICLVLREGGERRVPAVCNTGPREKLIAAFADRGIRTETK